MLLPKILKNMAKEGENFVSVLLIFLVYEHYFPCAMAEPWLEASF